MSFEELQKAWKSQNPAAKITIDADLLLKEVRRNQQQFWATIFWRDVREVGIAILLAAFFTFQTFKNLDWTEALVAFSCLGVGLGMLVDRHIQRKKQPATNDCLRTCLETSLHQVQHQIWLLKNVLWWYLLPLAIPLILYICHSTWQRRTSTADLLAGWVFVVLFVIAVDVALYWLNQVAVKKVLEPRRRELETLLTTVTSSS